MKTELTIDTHKSVGPYNDVYDHPMLIFIQQVEDGESSGHGPDITESLWTCLSCGYTDTDIRSFAHEECDREKNRVNQTMREFVHEHGYPDE